MRTYTIVSGLLFSIVGLAHVLRLIFAFPIVAGPYTIPMWLSWIGMFAAAALAIWAAACLKKVR